MSNTGSDGWDLLPVVLSTQTKGTALLSLAEISSGEGWTHLDVSSYQVRRLLVRLQGYVDGGKRPAGHLLHLPQQLLGKTKGDEHEGH